MAEFGDFAFATSKQVATEECEKMEKQVVEDLEELMKKWGIEVMDRIGSRLTTMGLDPEFSVEIAWPSPNMPVFTVKGKTYYGGPDNG